MLVFWILAGLATALCGWLITIAADRGRIAGESADLALVSASTTATAHELAELDRLKSRGLLDQAQWQSARAEAGRRLLAEPATAVVATSHPHDGRVIVIGTALVATLSLGLYLWVGSPGFGDQGYEQRVETWSKSTELLEPVQAAAVLEREVRLNPDQRRFLTMLGAARFQAGDGLGAASAFRRALAMDADDAQSWARLGESLVRAQDGVIGPDAEAAFIQAVRRDPGQLGALYFLGQAALERGDREGAATLWTPLIAALDPTDPRRADLQSQLAAAPASASTSAPARGAAR